jgi:hypothetical protein
MSACECHGQKDPEELRIGKAQEEPGRQVAGQPDPESLDQTSRGRLPNPFASLH